jgi:type VI secretion system protein ImpH
MATARRNGPTALIDELLARPGSFDFFQAVRLLEIAYGRDGSFRAVGEDNPPERECIRFTVSPSLAFAATDVDTIERREAAGPPVAMAVRFLGFVGTAGVLPQPYSELVLERLQLRDSALQDWVDLFHHRLLSLFYRAWTKYRFPFAYERELRERGRVDTFTRVLQSLAGRGLEALQDGSSPEDSLVVFQGGHFARRVRTASGLGLALSDVLGVPVRVQEFVGRWLDIPLDERCILPASGGGDLRVRLGGGATLGARVWDVQSKVRLHLGPLTLAEFERLRPGGAGSATLTAIAAEYVGLELDFDLRFLLRPGESPGTRLASRESPTASRLGLDSWLEAEVPGRAGRVAALRCGNRRVVS